MSHFNDTKTSDHVGGPTITYEFKLIDLPDYKYLTTNNPPQGEVLIRGPGVF